MTWDPVLSAVEEQAAEIVDARNLTDFGDERWQSITASFGPKKCEVEIKDADAENIVKIWKDFAEVKWFMLIRVDR